MCVAECKGELRFTRGHTSERVGLFLSPPWRGVYVYVIQYIYIFSFFRKLPFVPSKMDAVTN